jgi:hypothetical protein
MNTAVVTATTATVARAKEIIRDAGRRRAIIANTIRTAGTTSKSDNVPSRRKCNAEVPELQSCWAEAA